MAGKYQELKVDDVNLDLGNPRIKRFLEIYEGEISADQIALALGFGEDSSTTSGTKFFTLKESIRTNGGIIHPIIVNQDSNDKLTVIEGNTRLAIYREFLEKKAAGKWGKIPAIVYSNLPQKEIDGIRLQAHLVGPREWDPYSKAKYLQHLNDAESMPFSQLVDYCGGQQSQVIQLIAAYENMEEFYRPVVDADGEDFDVRRFSGFVELQKKSIKQALLGEGYTISDFATWIHKRRIDPLNHVRLLPRILKNPKAKEIFLSKGSKEARKVFDQIDAVDTLKDASLEALCNETRNRLASLPWEELKALKSNNESDLAFALIGLKDEIESILELKLGDGD